MQQNNRGVDSVSELFKLHLAYVPFRIPPQIRRDGIQPRGVFESGGAASGKEAAEISGGPKHGVVRTPFHINLTGG